MDGEIVSGKATPFLNIQVSTVQHPRMKTYQNQKPGVFGNLYVTISLLPIHHFLSSVSLSQPSPSSSTSRPERQNTLLRVLTLPPPLSGVTSERPRRFQAEKRQAASNSDMSAKKEESGLGAVQCRWVNTPSAQPPQVRPLVVLLYRLFLVHLPYYNSMVSGLTSTSSCEPLFLPYVHPAR